METFDQSVVDSVKSALPQVPTLASAVTESLNFTKFSSEKQLSFVVGYNPKVSEMQGYRHAVVRYRITGTNKVEKPAKMATVPQVTLPDSEYLMPKEAAQVLVGILEDQQDAMIRDMIESGAVTIKWDEITLEKTLSSLTATRVSNRLTKEMIENWAAIAIRSFTDARAIQIAEQKGFAADEVRVGAQKAGTFNAYCFNLAKLAAAVPNVGQETATALQNFMSASKLDDDLAKVLNKKLHAILNPAAVGDL